MKRLALDVQRERIITYCKMFRHNLIAIHCDDHTGRDMQRPGFQAALAKMVANDAMLMAVSLERISRNVGDWNSLLDTYFGKGTKHRFLGFDCAGMDPKTATGRMFLMVRAAIAQGEIDATSERTQVAMDHLKAQGIPCGGLRPYGKAYSKRLDEHSRRVVVDVTQQMETIYRIRKLHSEGKGIKTITDFLNAEKRPAPKCQEWNRASVRRLLQREGLLSIKHWDRSNAVRDTDIIEKRIAELRSKKLSNQFTKENLMPPIGSQWHVQTVLNAWDKASTYDQQKAIEISVGLHKATYDLRNIAKELTLRSLTPKRGGAWYSEQVRHLLMLAKLSA